MPTHTINRMSRKVKSIFKNRSPVRLWANRIFQLIKKYLLAGMLALVPLYLTFFILKTIAGTVDSAILPLLPDIFPFTLPGSGLVLLFLILLVMGFATSNFLGKNFVKLYDYGFGKLPLVGDVYLGIKGTLKNFTSEGAQSFSEAVLVEYPRDGFWSLGFITGQAAGEWQKKLGRGFVIVFIPFGPVPTQGALCITKRNKLIKLDMKSQEAIGYVVSLGAAHKMEIVEKNKPILLDKKMLKGLVYGGKKNRPTKTKRRS